MRSSIKKVKPKYIIWTTLFLFLIVFFFYGELIIYAIRQGYGQAQIILKAQPVEVYLKDPNYPDSLKAKIRLIEQIRRFAFDSLGLDENGSYTRLYDQQGEPLLWTVTACPAYKLEPYEWEFPLIGSFSYKGFFNREIAEEEANRLKAQGYDVDVGEVNAWSTLGFLEDPILSNMLYRSEGKLANLIIHELTHGTIYIKDGVEYNENLADFIGDYGATWFMKSTFGENTEYFRDYKYSKTDYDIFADYVLLYAKRLDSLYNTFNDSIAIPDKENKKQAMIRSFVDGIRSLPLKNQRYTCYFDNYMPNNTYFMEFVRYQAQQNEFEQEFHSQFNGDIRAYIAHLKKQHKRLLW